QGQATYPDLLGVAGGDGEVVLCQRLRDFAPVRAGPNADQAPRWIKQRHGIELRKIDHQSTVIGRLSSQQMAAAANRDEESLLPRKMQRGHDILVALGARDHHWASLAIERSAQRLVRWTVGCNHLPCHVVLELGDDLLIHTWVSLLR